MTRERAQAPSSPPVTRPRLLLVEDEPALLATTEAILCDEYVVVTAATVEQALARLGEGAFDIVCTDFELGGAGQKTGADLLRHVATLPGFAARVLVTGKQEVSEGALHCYILIKPCDPQRLLDVVDRALKQTLARRKAASVAAETKRVVSHVIESTRSGSLPAPAAASERPSSPAARRRP